MSDPLYPPDDFGEAFDAAAARLREAVAAACARPGPWPARVRAALVLEWARAHRGELLANWTRAREHQPVRKIEPLP